MRLTRLKTLLRRIEEMCRKISLRGERQVKREVDAAHLHAKIKEDLSALFPQLKCPELGNGLAFDTFYRVMQSEVADEQRRTVESRQQGWHEATRCDWKCDKQQVYDLVRDEPPPQVTVLGRQDGSFTADAGEVDAMLRQEWLPVFQRYSPTRPWPNQSGRSSTSVLGCTSRIHLWVASNHLCLGRSVRPCVK